MEPSLTDLFMNVATYGGAIAAFGITALKGFYTIKQKHKGLVTRFGKHVRTNHTPGLKLKIPFIEKVYRVSMQEKQVEEDLETKTTDNLFVRLPIAIQFEVSDAAVYMFNKERPVELMKKVVAAAVREYTSGKDFQELYDERQQIKDAVLKKVDEEVSGFGIQINNIVIDEPRASDEVKATFDRVRSSALEKDAAKNEADAEYIKTVKRAEADKERNILIGEGVAGFRERIASGYTELRKKLIGEGVNPEAADHFMEEAMRLDTLRDVGDKGNMVIVTPDSSTGQQIATYQTLRKAAGGLAPAAPAV